MSTVDMIRDRPMLFSGSMVRALLDGRKTQTRRVVKPEGAVHIFQFRGTTAAAGADEPTGEWGWCGSERVVHKHIHCPYGKPGDRLWVRETFAKVEMMDGRQYAYRATEDLLGCMPWKPSIHMPRWASRITLEITGVRVERLQDISEADAIAEGCIQPNCGEHGNQSKCWSYRDIWSNLHGPESWAANPWVWVIEFRRVQ